MKDVYIKKTDLSRWVAKHFQNQDLISIDDLINCIEDLDSEIDHLREKMQDREWEIEDNYRRVDSSHFNPDKIYY